MNAFINIVYILVMFEAPFLLADIIFMYICGLHTYNACIQHKNRKIDIYVPDALSK